jgi:thiamine-monophosphate kinase
MDSEAKLIKRIARAVPSDSSRSGGSGLRVGIGDDAAIFVPERGSDWVSSCDAFLEGVHFLANVHPPDSVGYKALVRAASDLAAMGATPRLFLLTLALPSDRTGKWLGQFLKGMGRAARLLGMSLAGGDTSKAASISMSITVLGEAARGRVVLRSGARPGDIIYVSGKLGRAQLGLELMQWGVGRKQRFAALTRQHLYPRIQVSLGRWLAEGRIASAMMDLSDGLSTDLGRLASASNVGARIHAERMPRVAIPAGLSKLIPGLKADPLQMALHGGEDYELLFTVPQRKVKLLNRAPDFREITAIGEITRDKSVMLVEPGGKAKPLTSQGWDPFRKP